MAGFADQSLTNSQLSKLPARPRVGRREALLRASRRHASPVASPDREQRQALARLTQRELADFGASSADVYRELATPFWRAPPPC